jgi:hypothetical protein
MSNNVQLFGAGLKSDFSGHDIVYASSLSIWGDAADQYQALIPGYFNTVRNHTLIARKEGDLIFQHVCPNASDWPHVTSSSYFSPAGNITICGKTVEAWQAEVPGVLANVTARPIDPALTAEAIVGLARAVLQGAQPPLVKAD